MKSNLHEWTIGDNTIAYYIALYGTDSLRITDQKELAELVIGSTANSLSMQVANFRYLLNLEGYTLSDYSKMQEDVVRMMSGKSWNEVRQIVDEVILRSDIATNATKKNLAECEEKQKEFKKRSEEELSRQLAGHKKYGRNLVFKRRRELV